MPRTLRLAWVVALAGSLIPGTLWAESQGPVPFKKLVLTDKYYCDGLAAADIDRDGNNDVVAGPFWYAGPDFTRAHEFYPAIPLDPAESPSNCMFMYVHDFNGDTWPDILVLGRVHMHQAFWYENPKGAPGHWPKHFAFHRIQGETPPFADLSGDGRPELVCHWENRFGWVGPDWTKPTEPWQFHPLTEEAEYNQFYHGTGVADINADGRPDLVLNDGIWFHPGEGGLDKPWPHLAFRFAEKGGAQIPAYDVDGDGDCDILTALNAHAWGVAWFEQIKRDGELDFVEHKIMGDRSEIERYGVAFTQPHALDVADFDGDGLTDLVVGKRRWAHGPKGDIEPAADPVVYWFRLKRTDDGVVFHPHLIDDASGVGVQIVATDVTGDGKPDLLTASKLGTFVFINGRQSP